MPDFRVPITMRLLIPAFCLFSFVALPSGEAINLQLTQADIERALVIARERDSEWARFHAPYVSTLGGPFVERVEIVTEFRRVVMMAEERILKGDRGFAYSPQLAQAAIKTWSNRVSVIVRLRFHPQNNYITVPEVGVSLDGPSAEEAFIGVLKEPVYGFADRDTGNAPLLGAVAEGVFDAKLIGQSQRTVTVRLSGKDLAAVRLDFGRVE